jgi:peptide/nickel transport system substrate-binding protein
MALSLAYRSGASWNESGYANPAFDEALDEAEAILNVEQRKAKMEKVEQILQDSAIVICPCWRPVYSMTTEQVHGYLAHPTQYHQLNKVWIET